jgi:hypothetical protein
MELSATLRRLRSTEGGLLLMGFARDCGSIKTESQITGVNYLRGLPKSKVRRQPRDPGDTL